MWSAPWEARLAAAVSWLSVEKVPVGDVVLVGDIGLVGEIEPGGDIELGGLLTLMM